MNEEEKLVNEETIPASEETTPENNEVPQKEEKSSPEKAQKKSSPEKKPSQPMSRKRKHGLISLMTTVLVVAAVILVNVIATELNSKNYGLTADLTKLRSFELTETTKGVMSRLDKKVTISFMSDRSSYISLDSYCKQTVFIAEEMAKCSKGTLSVEYVDIVRNPAYADDYDQNELNTTDIVVSCGENKQILTTADIFNFEEYSGNYRYIASSSAEAKLDDAILSVTRSFVIKTVIFTNNTDTDNSYFKKMLTYNGYDVTEMSLDEEDIPAVTDMAVIFAPSEDYSAAAVKKIKNFLNNSGNYGKTLLFAASPTDIETPNLDDLLDEYGLYLKKGYAFDSGDNVYLSDSLTGVIARQPDSAVPYMDIDEKKPIITPIRTRPVECIKDSGAVPLLVYSENSGMQPFGADESWSAEDSVTGDVCVFGMGQKGIDSKSTVLAAGSYTMFDKAYSVSYTSDKLYYTFILDSIHGREIHSVDMDIPDKVLSRNDIDIDKQTAVNLGFIVYALIPLIILGTGLTVYLMRKNR